MGVEYLRLTNETTASLPFVKILYEHSFPENERRHWPSFLNLLLNESQMHAELIRNGGQDAGVVVWWAVKGWLFIEHLAISEVVRGKGLGAEVSSMRGWDFGSIHTRIGSHLTIMTYNLIQCY